MTNGERLLGKDWEKKTITMGETIYFDGEQLLTREEAVAKYSEEKINEVDSTPRVGMKLNEALDKCKKIETAIKITDHCGATSERKN